MVSRDKVEWVRESLTAAGKTLEPDGDPKLQLANARRRIVWMTLKYMPTPGATAALVAVQRALMLLEERPPAKSNDLVAIRRAIDVLIDAIDEYLRPRRAAVKPVDGT
jgi:hypothetical protein